MYSPAGVQAEKKICVIHFFIFFYWRDETVPMKEGLNRVIAFTANG